MEKKAVTVEFPLALLDLMCRYAASRGETLPEFLMDGVEHLLHGSELEEWRNTNGRVAIEDYEREFGAFTEEQIDKARRAWQLG